MFLLVAGAITALFLQRALRRVAHVRERAAASLKAQ
jgi:hypothetical protein